MRQRQRSCLTGEHSLENVLSCWPVKSAKEISSLSLYVCVFLCQRMSLWHLNTEGELRVLARRESCIVPEKKGSPMACGFGKNSSATVGFFFINLKYFLSGSLFLVLQDFILIHQESGLCGKPYRAVSIYLGHFGNLGKQTKSEVKQEESESPRCWLNSQDRSNSLKAVLKITQKH